MYSASPLFRKAYSYAKRSYDIVGILSAKYDFLLPEDMIEPYELTLKKMRVHERRTWADRVFQQLSHRIDMSQINSVYFHAGKEYREYLIPKLRKIGIECDVPLKGLSFGQQLAWYNDPFKY